MVLFRLSSKVEGCAKLEKPSLCLSGFHNDRPIAAPFCVTTDRNLIALAVCFLKTGPACNYPSGVAHRPVRPAKRNVALPEVMGRTVNMSTVQYSVTVLGLRFGKVLLVVHWSPFSLDPLFTIR
jgi:hypothetical protein